MDKDRVHITARHILLTPALSEYVRKKMEKVDRYYPQVLWTQTIMNVEKHRHVCEVLAHVRQKTFRYKAVAGDLYAAIDVATEKLDRQLARFKDRQVRTVRRKSKRRERDFQSGWLIKENKRKGKGHSNSLVPGIPQLTEVNSFVIQSLTIGEAVSELETRGDRFLVFRNDESKMINFIYRRDNKSYGLMEEQSGFGLV